MADAFDVTQTQGRAIQMPHLEDNTPGMETDTSGTASTTDNRITLYTCVRDERDFRWKVTAVEA